MSNLVLPRDAVGIEEIRDLPEVLESRVPRALEDFRGFVEDGGVTGQPDELPQGRRQIRPTQPRELRDPHREVALGEGVEDDSFIRGRERSKPANDSHVPDPRLKSLDPTAPHRRCGVSPCPRDPSRWSGEGVRTWETARRG